MKLILPVKILLAFMAVSSVSIIMVVAANRYVANTNFTSYLEYKGMKTLAVFAGTLADVHQKNNGWEIFSRQPEMWDQLIQERWPSDERIPTLTGTDQFLGSEVSRATDIAATGLPSPSSQSPAWPEGVLGNLYPHVSLFNAQKELVAGERNAMDKLNIVPVNIGEETVGWVGLAFGEKLTHPVDVEFMKKQSRVFLIIGTAVFLVSILIAFILGRHLLAPIKRLSEATEALGDRHFGIRIPVVSTDELGTLANRFNTMAEKLETYERNQKQWLSDISHELRTPLSVLIGEIEAIQDGVRKPDRKSLSSLCDEAKHLNKIVNDLHYLSLTEAGSPPVEMKAIKPLPVLSQAIYFFKNRLEKDGISVEVFLDPEAADLQMQGDSDRLMQLFNNLLENALTHTDKPGVLTIKQERQGNQMVISFEDTGPGVSEQALLRLFDRLYRADPSRSRKTGNSGLGLAICKSIVENHNGRISAHHSEKGGLKFEVMLPLSVH